MDYSKSNLGGIRNRHATSDVRMTVQYGDEPPVEVRPPIADGPPKRRRRERELVQLEVPGAERPRILPIDDAVRSVLLIEAEIADGKARLARAREDVQDALVEHHLTSYLYVDGEFEYPVKLDASTKLVIKKRKRRTEEQIKHDTNDGRSPDKADR